MARKNSGDTSAKSGGGGKGTKSGKVKTKARKRASGAVDQVVATAAGPAGTAMPGNAVEVPAPAGRSADQIGRTSKGPRPVPDLAGGAAFRPLDYDQRRLDNGLDVVAIRKPGTPLVELRLRVPFGGRTQVHAARAELLAATLLLGTARRSRAQVDVDLARVGGHLDASVDPQRLLISGSALSSGLATVLDVLADSLTEPAFARRDVNGERDRIVEHLAVAAAQPAAVARKALQYHRFGQHPAAFELPEAELVAGVAPVTLRALHNRRTVPSGSLLVLVGDLRPRAAIAAAAKALAGWTVPGRAVPLAPPPAVPAGPVRAIDRTGAVQSQVRLTAPAVLRDDPDYPAAALANLVYGGYFSSRLVENIREDKGFTYSAHSSFEFWPGSAALTVSFDTATSATAAALLEARYELGRIALTAPSETEIEAARNYATGSLATSLATQAGLASNVSALVGQGLPVQWLVDHPSRLAAVTADEVAAAAARLLRPTSFTGVVVGDLDQLSPALSALGDVTLS